MLLSSDDRTIAVAITILAMIAIELWRRTLRNRSPRWVHGLLIGLVVLVGASAAYSELALRRLAGTFDDLPPSEKTTTFAIALSKALNAYAIAVVATIVAVIALIVATIRVRRLPEGGPVARLRG